MLEQVLVLMQAEKEHFTALHLIGMDAGYNGQCFWVEHEQMFIVLS